MSIESDIIDAITALGLFTRVRYLVATGESETDPIQKPLFVLTDGGRDFTAAQTFCGTTIAIHNFDAMIMATTSAECRSLFESCRSALQTIANVTAAVDSYDESSGAYICNFTLVS
jgi:hypothetical protein